MPEIHGRLLAQRKLRQQLAGFPRELCGTLAVALAQVPGQVHQAGQPSFARGGQGALLLLQLLLVDDEGKGHGTHFGRDAFCIF